MEFKRRLRLRGCSGYEGEPPSRRWQASPESRITMAKRGLIHYGTRAIPFEIRPSRRRKTVGINIGFNGDVVVRSPHLLNEKKIREIVEKRVQLIVKKQKFIKTHTHSGSEKNL